jgi:hypothetical protein
MSPVMYKLYSSFWLPSDALNFLSSCLYSNNNCPCEFRLIQTLDFVIPHFQNLEEFCMTISLQTDLWESGMIA